MFKHKLMTLTYYEGVGNTWELFDDFILVWGDQNITGTGEINSETRVSLYPNPAARQVTFSVDANLDRLQVEVLDIQGKMVINQICENNKPISIESLYEGLYFYSLESTGHTYTGKFLVKH